MCTLYITCITSFWKVIYWASGILYIQHTTSGNSWHTNQHFGNFCCHCSLNIRWKFLHLCVCQVFERTGLYHVCLDKQTQMQASWQHTIQSPTEVERKGMCVIYQPWHFHWQGVGGTFGSSLSHSSIMTPTSSTGLRGEDCDARYKSMFHVRHILVVEF